MGLCCIGLYRPKDEYNIGGVLRAAHCYGADQVMIEGARGRALNAPSNTPMAHRHIPTMMVTDLLSHRPWDVQIVVVDLIPDAVPLHRFTHPKRALYLFGPEDGTLGAKHTQAAQHVVYVPTLDCMNLAAAVNVVLYDRCAKFNLWPLRKGVAV